MAARIPIPGLVIANKYRLGERLGGGGMGEVFQATHLLNGRTVALKILRSQLSEDENVTRRFFQEAQAADKIRHPNIVDVIDAGFSEAGPYIAMELLEGESSGATLTRMGKLPLEAVTAIGLSVLEALDVAHRAGIIHRDLKPENVYLHVVRGPSPSVTVKLLDFGIAKVLEPVGPTPRTHTGVVFGTPDYLSPEQANGDYLLDGRSDVFAVGVLLFELATGTRPFRAATAVATAYKVVHAAAPTLAEAGGLNHPIFEAVVARALRKRPEERYATANEFARELELVAPDSRARVAALERLFGGKLDDPARWSSSPAPGGSPRPRELHWAADGGIPSLARRTSRPSRMRVSPFSEGHLTTPISSPLSPSSSARPDTAPPSSPSNRDPGMRASAPPPPATSFDPGTPGLRLRGSALRAIDRSIIRRHGILLRASVLDHLPASYANDFRHSTIAGASLYSLEVFDTYASALGVLTDTRGNYWREVGRASAERELANLLRPTFRSADDLALLRRASALWSWFFDFGSWKVQPEDGRVVLQVSDLSPAPTALRAWLVGMVEQTLWSAGFASAAVTILEGEFAKAPDLVLEIVSGPRH